MYAQPPAVTSIPAMSTATITRREIDVNTGSSDVDLVPKLGPVSTSVGESVPAVELSSPPLSDQPVPVSVGESVPAVELSSPPLSDQPVPVSVWESVPAVELSSPPLSKQPVPVPVVDSVPAVDSSSSPLSGQSSLASSQTLAWGARVTRRCPCPPIVFRRDTPRTFRRRAVCIMCRQFRRDFCFGHQGMLSSFHQMGYCCRRRWTISVTRSLVTR